MKTTLLALALLAFAALGSFAPGQSAGARDPMLVAAAAKYDAAHWPAGPRRAGCDLSQLRLPALHARASERAGDILQRRFADAQGKEVVLVEMTVRDTVDAARNDLLRHVAYVQSTKTLPTAASRGIKAGDVGFVGYAGPAQDRIAWLAFAAGNVEFRVVSLDPSTPVQPDVQDAVERLSALVQKSALVADGAPLPAPSIERLAADPASCRAGDSVRLDVDVKEPTGGVAQLDWEVAGSAQGYVENDDNGVPRFYATKDGHADVTLFATGVDGVIRSRQVAIEVGAKK